MATQNFRFLSRGARRELWSVPVPRWRRSASGFCRAEHAGSCGPFRGQHGDAKLPVFVARGTPGVVVVSPSPGSARMDPARGGAGGAPPRPPAPGEKRRPAQCEGPRLPKQGLSEAAAAARLRALPAQHDHGYSGNGLRLPPP